MGSIIRLKRLKNKSHYCRSRGEAVRELNESYDLLTDEEAQKLIRESANARNFSYSPYSKFKVGSALLCEDGVVRTGCNVENASFSVTICAERCALIKAVSEGRQRFRSIGIVADRIDGRLTTPCGVCRQMLSEFGDFVVYVASPDMQQVLVTTTHELLPHVFRKGTKDNFISSNIPI